MRGSDRLIQVKNSLEEYLEKPPGILGKLPGPVASFATLFVGSRREIAEEESHLLFNSEVTKQNVEIATRLKNKLTDILDKSAVNLDELQRLFSAICIAQHYVLNRNMFLKMGIKDPLVELLSEARGACSSFAYSSNPRCIFEIPDSIDKNLDLEIARNFSHAVDIVLDTNITDRVNQQKIDKLWKAFETCLPATGNDYRL